LNKSTSTVLRETEIRPDHLMQDQAKRFAADIRRLLQHKDEFVYISCPACGSKNARKAFEKYEMTYVVCSECAMMYVNPRPTPAILEMYYATSENYKYWNKYIFPASESARREKIFRPRAEKLAEICRRHNVQTDVLLEVGAGFGTFCEEIRRIGLFRRVIAVEPTPDLATTCRQKDLEVIEKPIEQVRFERDTINVIACFEVIEHLFSPRDFLNYCAAVLAPNGLMIVTCPNVKGFDIVVLQEVSDTVDVQHLNYFHPNSLSLLFAECGFEVLETLTPGKLDAELARKKILKGEFDISAQPFLKQILIDEWDRVGDAFQQFLAYNQLSSHMWLVARKRGKELV
jgi:2-polyprenyl-3-methyl-5-hydroxy-6-metoxy-1,4-benzoquinol methylase/ribosomal protein S27E